MPLPSSDYPNPLINGLYTANADTTYVSTVSMPQQNWDFSGDYYLTASPAPQPMLTGTFAAIAEYVLKSFDFSALWQGIGANTGNLNFGNWNSPFVYNPSVSNSDSSSDSSDLGNVKAFLNKAVELTKEKDKKIKIKLEEQVLSDINDALDTIGSDEEKLEAMTAALKAIPEATRKKIIEVMDKDSLSEIGYQRFTNDDKEIKKKSQAIKDKLDVITKTGNCDTDLVTDLIETLPGEKNILTVISAWNNTHSNNGGCILGDIVDKITSAGNNLKAEDKKAILNKQIKPLVNAMISASDTIISELKDAGYDVSDLKIKRKALNNSNNELTEDLSETACKALVKAYKEMYVALRVNLAQQKDAEINDNYGFLNSDEDKVIDESMILDSTKEDLRKENLGSIEVTPGEMLPEATDFTDMETDEALETLANDSLDAKSVGNQTYYVTKSGPSDSKHYYYKDGDVIKEIKNAKSIDENGNIKFHGNAASQTIEAYITAQKDKDDNEVAPEIIEETNKSLKVIEDLISEGRLELANMPSVADVIFVNKENKLLSPDKKNHYYTVKDGQLCEIKYKDRPDAPLSGANGKFKIWKGDKWCKEVEKDGAYPDDFAFVEVSKDSVQATLPLESEISVPATEQGFIALGIKPVRMYKKSDIGNKMPCMVDYEKGADYYVLNGNYYSAMGAIVTNVTKELYIPDENASPENKPPEKESEWYSKMCDVHKSLRYQYYRVNADFAKKVLIYEQVTGVKLDFTPPSWYDPQDCYADMIMDKFLKEYKKLEQPGFDIKSYKCPFVNGIVYPEDKKRG